MSEYDFWEGFSCDYCGETIGGNDYGYNFNESLELRKSEGWINRKFDGEWFSFCCEECLNNWLADHHKRPTPRKVRK